MARIDHDDITATRDERMNPERIRRINRREDTLGWQAGEPTPRISPPARDDRSKREKTIRADVAHRWAHGLNSRNVREWFNSSGNFYAEGDTIYSYGSHFPLARRVVWEGDVFYFVNPARYSHTTAKHQWAIRVAIPFDCTARRCVDLPPALWGTLAGPDEQHPERGRDAAKDVRDHYQSLAAKAYRVWQDNTSKTRALCYRLKALQAAMTMADVAARWVSLADTFHLQAGLILPPTKEIPKKAWDAVAAWRDVNESAIRDAVRARADERANRQSLQGDAERRARALRYRDLGPGLIRSWRKGGEGSIKVGQPPRTLTLRDVVPYPVLRFVEGDADHPEGVVETSRMARVGLASARRLYDALPRYLPDADAPGGVQTAETANGYGSGRVTSEGLRIGCHRIPWYEVEAFGRYMGWPVPPELDRAARDTSSEV